MCEERPSDPSQPLERPFRPSRGRDRGSARSASCPALDLDNCLPFTTSDDGKPQLVKESSKTSCSCSVRAAFTLLVSTPRADLVEQESCGVLEMRTSIMPLPLCCSQYARALLPSTLKRGASCRTHVRNLWLGHTPYHPHHVACRTVLP